MRDASKVTYACGQPRLHLRHPLLHPPNLPLQPLSAFPVLLGRGIKLPLVIGEVSRQFVALPLKGLSLVRRRCHYVDSGWPRLTRPLGRDQAGMIARDGTGMT